MADVSFSCYDSYSSGFNNSQIFGDEISDIDQKIMNVAWLVKEFSSEKIVTESIVLAVKVLFFPITLLYLCIERIAANAGLGTDEDVKVDETKRDELRDRKDSEEIKFGYEGGPVLEGMIFGFDDKNPSPDQKTILLCSGSHKSYEHYVIPMVEEFRKMGHRVMVFNYEGFGNSEGTRSEEGVYRSVEAAYDYLKDKKGCKPESIVGWGYSLGSAAVTELATKHEVDIVLDRGIPTMSQAASADLKDRDYCQFFCLITRMVFACVCHFDNLSKMHQVKGRVLIAQESQNDSYGLKLKKALEGANKKENEEFFYMNNVMTYHFHTDIDGELWEPGWFTEENLKGAKAETLKAFISPIPQATDRRTNLSTDTGLSNSTAAGG